MKPLRVYTLASTLNYNASTYYRLDVPLTTMEELGLPVEAIVDNGDPTIPNENRIVAIMSSDINLFYQPISENLREQMVRMRTLYPAKTTDGDWRYPPSFVMDSDDNLFMVHPRNPAYRDLGIRMPNGRLLRPGDSVGIVDEKGKTIELWRDGQGYPDGGGFDIARNLAKLTTYRDILATADAVTCSTPRVASYVREESGQSNTFVSPNMVRFDHYDNFDLRAHPDEVWILWQGSTTHFEDFDDIRGTLPLIVKQYPHVKFILWGALHPDIVQNVPTDRFRYVPWCRYQEYRLRLCTMNHDIAIAPLRPHKFNQCRSAIKFYESAVLTRPAAFLGQGGGTAYSDEIIEGETGMLWETPREFKDKLCTLIENETLRKQMAQNGHTWLRENRDAMKLAPKLYDFYQTVRARKREEVPLPDPNEWATRKEELLAAVNKQLVSQNGDRVLDVRP